jgi:hypothetical protein
MQPNQNTSLVLSLIKDDLINNKLINGLNTLGLSAGDYHLHLSETILNLIGLDTENDAINNLYFNLTQQSETLDLTDITNREKQLIQLATEIYSELLKQKQQVV